jgi:hypothetical protein
MTDNGTSTLEILDQLLDNYKQPEDFLGHEKSDPPGRGSGNSRNGTNSEDASDGGSRVSSQTLGSGLSSDIAGQPTER